jgi:alkylation response protein AidB-like acyl-CoA dehydrogenase
MDFAFSDEQQELQRVTRSFFTRCSSESDVRSLMDTDLGHDDAVWRQMATQIGLQGLAIPESLGGAGYGFVELGVALKEMGRCLYVGPFFASIVLATNALLLSGDSEAVRRYLPRIASGDLIATVAVAEPPLAGPDRVNLEARYSAAGWRLSGVKNAVLDGVLAELIVVAARSESGISLFTVDGAAPGLTRSALPCLDATRKLAMLDFDGVDAQLLGAEGGGWPVIEQVLDLAAVGMAAEQVGAAGRCLELSVEYAKDRIQFNRPIGSFQAVKHLCADMMVDLASAEVAVDYALWAASERDRELPVLACMTRALCSEMFTKVAFSTIQVHGGIGFTWEHPAHLYLRRAKSSELMFGTPDEQRELMMQRMEHAAR